MKLGFINGQRHCGIFPLYQYNKRTLVGIEARKGSLTISTYFSKLKKLWDELSSLVSVPSCSCGVSKEVTGLRVVDNLMQFLMGLNDHFDHVRNQILKMEPLLFIAKAYSMVLQS
ncbi:UNVERIFIED_CONTAM: hypothetical protein Scaly_2825300 [Sesamum calycinum]|uniref:Uncharacterized protein n=1 Tax=Sesamum calycinum TaxID=2727403 RepID=A0AAW2IUP0_9LAMI